MKTIKKVMLPVLAVLPLIYSALAVFFYLPDTVGVHFSISGEADRYGSKYEAFIFPVIILAVGLIYLLIRRIIGRSSSQENARVNANLDVLDSVNLWMLVLFNILCVFFLYVMKYPDIMAGEQSLLFVILSVAVGLLFVIIGNLMPKTRRNSFIGMRMKFTMDNDEHWYIANRISGIAMVISGIVTVIAGLVLRNFNFLIVMVISLVLLLTVAILVSYGKIKKRK